MDKQISAAFQEFQTQLAATDVWRLVNPKAREYSSYSGAHNSYSRLDYVMSSNLVQNFLEIKMDTIAVSESLLHSFLRRTLAKLVNGDLIT